MSETNRTSIHNCQVAESQIAELKAQVARLTEAADWDILNALDEVQDYKEQIAAVTEQLADLQAEIIRLRAGGCARDQHTTQYCGELQSLVARLTALADRWWAIVPTGNNWDDAGNVWNDAVQSCAREIREAIGGGDANQVGLLDIADAVIAEREEVMSALTEIKRKP